MSEATVEYLDRTGNAPLLQVLLEKRAALLNSAANITGCPSIAEDVVQDAFLRLNSSATPKLPIKAHANYVFQVVRNLAIDHYRRNELEQKRLRPEEEGLNVEADDAKPEEIQQHRQTLEIIDQALSELPDRTRYAFEMYRLHGMQQKEIAKKLGVSPTLVNFMVRDALIHCKAAVGHERNRHKST